MWDRLTGTWRRLIELLGPLTRTISDRTQPSRGNIGPVSRGDEPAEVRRRLRDALIARLAPDGWVVLDDEAGQGVTWQAFERPLDDRFAEIADIWQSLGGDRPAVTISDVHGGVCYEPLRRMWPLLGGQFRGPLVRNFEEYSDERTEYRLEVDSVGGIESASAELARLVTERTTAHRRTCWCLDRRWERATIACPLTEGPRKTSPPSGGEVPRERRQDVAPM